MLGGNFFYKKHIIDVTFITLYRLDYRMELKEFKIKIFPLRKKLLSYAQKLCDDPLDAEDAVQEVFIKLWKQRDKLDEYRSTEAFAMSITHNLCMDMWRAKKPSGMALEKVQISDGKENSPDKKLEEKDAYDSRTSIINALPSLQRTIIYMKDVEGYESEGIGEITSCAPEAIRSNLSRARKKARELYLQAIQERRKNIC